MISNKIRSLRPRIEYKYYLPSYLESQFVADLMHFAKRDDFASFRADGSYDVASIYYDDFNLKSYHEKEDGLTKRVKLRLRFYPPISKYNYVNVELKHKDIDRIMKQKANISGDHLKAILKGERNGYGPEAKDGALAYMYKLVVAENYHPFVRIDYRRKAFFDRHDPNVRMTIDSNIYCSRVCTNIDFRPDIPVLSEELRIFEIKSPDYMPFWLVYLLKKYPLERRAISKYSLAVTGVAANSSALLK